MRRQKATTRNNAWHRYAAFSILIVKSSDKVLKQLSVHAYTHAIAHYASANLCKKAMVLNNILLEKFKSSHPEVFLGKRFLKICSKFTRAHPYRSAISIKLLCNFIEITLQHGYSPVKLLHIFRSPFPRNISGGLLVKSSKLSIMILLHFALFTAPGNQPRIWGIFWRWKYANYVKMVSTFFCIILLRKPWKETQIRFIIFY